MWFQLRNNDFTLNDGEKERSRILKNNNSIIAKTLKSVFLFFSLRITELVVIIIMLRNRDYRVDFTAEFNSNFKQFNWSLPK